MGEDQVVQGEVGAAGEEAIDQSEFVQMSREEYKNLVSELTEMKVRLSDVQAEKEMRNVERERRVNTPNQQVQPPPTNQPPDFENMSKQQIVQFIGQQGLQPILEMVMTLAVKDEIRDVSSRYTDFWEYGDDVKKTAMANPNMTVEDAYHIVKSKKGSKAPVEEKASTVRPAPRVAPSERGGVTRSTVTQNPSLSIRGAAEKALSEMTSQFDAE